ncbi:hypothetical protein VOLCADRAFT_88490 [Volvox carteri f. nagariensis]|uniref:Biotin-protein ligase N-terminal domain-containing protein n=1 Tax=Volvox carteri f. nagariensis TaxID=3068 RepID=D8TP50_VOLCA|nr:uncharacterized protein VOLCADRAFT_88490 [Volvox carteri f. nagariensis]EFJ50700.1 hypothetical protein VOLCADRAFT_88490 [Volvox carteri f. nagariensis]|eukprot:XP_002948293.1 hypothetical protein VOLCADRAFT_88490 [Volvox carteri f. nagariensis]
MPGGADLPYCKHLNGHGNRLLRDYVAGGGSYLGICAGAYYACRRVEFEVGGPLEVVGDRELCFFPGAARGPAYPGFDYLSERGAQAAPIRFRQPPLSPPAAAPPSLTTSTISEQYGRSSAGQRNELVWPAGTPGHDGGDGGGGGGGGTDVTPPRLSRHHLVFQGKSADGIGGGGREDGVSGSGGNSGAVRGIGGGSEPCRDVPDSGCPEGPLTGREGGGSETTERLRKQGLDAVPRPWEHPDGAGGEYDNWVYCRDYSNGGPVFVLGTPVLTTGIGSDADVPSATTSTAVSTACSTGDRRTASASSRCTDTRTIVQDNLEILAVYPELGDAIAAVRCRVGTGVAVLCGTHPEMPHEALMASVQLYDEQQAQRLARLGADLAAWEVQRQKFWAALLLACCTATATEMVSTASTSMATVGKLAASTALMPVTETAAQSGDAALDQKAEAALVVAAA